MTSDTGRSLCVLRKGWGAGGAAACSQIRGVPQGCQRNLMKGALRADLWRTEILMFDHYFQS